MILINLSLGKKSMIAIVNEEDDLER